MRVPSINTLTYENITDSEETADFIRMYLKANAFDSVNMLLEAEGYRKVYNNGHTLEYFDHFDPHSATLIRFDEKDWVIGNKADAIKRLLAMGKTFKCPACKSENVWISARISVNPNIDPSEGLGDPEWDGNDAAYCHEDGCEWSGDVALLLFTRARRTKP